MTQTGINRERRAVIEALERRLQGRSVPVEVLVDRARAHPDFAAAWLAHVVGSAAGQRELALILAVVDEVRPSLLDELSDFWGNVAEQEALVIDLARAHEALNRELTAVAMAVAEPGDTAVKIWSVLDRVGSGANLRQPAQGPVAVAPLPLAERHLTMLRQLAGTRLRPADVYGQQQKSEKLTQVRDSDQALMPTPTESTLVGSFERLMARACGLDLAQAEAMVVLRYRPGQQYRWHRDYIQPSTPAVREELARFGQRVHTGILYLNHGFEGGATEFRDWGLSLRPAAGECVSFSSVDDQGKPEPASIHRGAPVIDGEKWIGTLWFRGKRLWNRVGLLDAPPP